MDDSPGPGAAALSVVIATRDRADALARTLADMAALDREGLEVEWIVVDNGSRDDTPGVLAAFEHRLPLRRVHEPRGGKNRALNTVLDDGSLGEIVVFADDDMTPAPDWLRQIVAACARHPDAAVFGGRVLPRWAVATPAAWLTREPVVGVCFAVQDLGETDRPYPPGRHPFGGNFWVRRAVLTPDLRFDEALGPRPGDRLMGGETTFVERLAERGHPAVYCGRAAAHHRIPADALDPRAVHRRGFRFGRSLVHWHGPEAPETLERSRALWTAGRLAALKWNGLRLAAGALHPSRDRGGTLGFEARVRLGSIVESLRRVYSATPRPDSALTRR